MKLLPALFSCFLLAACAKQASDNSFGAEAGIDGGVLATAELPEAKSVVMVAIPKGEPVLIMNSDGKPYIDKNGHERTHQLSNICTGTLISENVVLTAAHCVLVDNNDVLKKTVGKNTVVDAKMAHILFGLNPKQAPAANLQVTEIVILESYNSDDPKTPDLAMIRFAGDRPAGTVIAQLPNELDAKSPIKNWTAIGYGRIDGAVAHADTSGNLLRTIKMKYVLRKDNHDIASQKDGGACFGDSGSPGFIHRASGESVVMGVFSGLNVPDGQKSNPKVDACRKYISFYTDIGTPDYLKWIKDFIGAN